MAAATGEGGKQQFSSVADGNGNAPVKYPSFKAPKLSFSDGAKHNSIDVFPLLVKEADRGIKNSLVQDVCTISVLPDEGNTIPQCTSQFTLLSFVKALLPSKSQMLIDAQLNCQKTQNRINVLLGGTDSYQSCVVDINVEKGNGAEAEEVVASLKSESVIKLSQRDAMMHQRTGGEDTSVLLHLIQEKLSFYSPSYTMDLSCLALVPRSDHAALSLVSKRFHSVLASQEFYKTRSLLGRTQEFLYVCLSTTPNPTPSWFLLRRETNKNQLIPIPSFPSQPETFSSFVALDWGIYVIGGFKDVRSPDVLLLDCRTNTWRKVPSMSVGRAAAAAGVIDGKIYVFGGCEELSSPNWAEVFDPNTQTWETLVPMDDRNEGDNVIRETLVMDKKVYAVDFWSGSLFYYSPGDGKWGRKKIPEQVQSYYCVMEKVLYGCDEVGNVVWRDSEELEWKRVKGLEALQWKRVRKLSSFGGNIGVFWVGLRGDVWCAEISLERRGKEGEIWGRIEWSEAVATFYRSFTRTKVEVLYAAAVNV
ncbi:unnamed protein product [Brassica rapa subsp. narinosa]